jgi:hypothetical protein
MAHKRKEIRDYVVTQLESAFGAQATIYNARYLYPKAEDGLQNPVINVFTPEDSSELTDDDANNNRIQMIEIILFVAGDEEHEQPGAEDLSIINRVDAACSTIEDTIGGFRQSFGGLIFKNTYTGTVINIVGEENSGYLIAVATIKFDANYFEDLT